MDFETFAIAKGFDFMVKYSALILLSLSGQMRTGPMRTMLGAPKEG